MVNTEDKKWKKFIEQCANFCKKSGLKSQQSIYEWLVDDLAESFPKASKWKIESVAEDVTESVCLKLNIPQRGIR